MYSKKTLEESRRRFMKIAEFGFLLTHTEKTLITAVIDMIGSHLEALEKLDDAQTRVEDLVSDLNLSDQVIDYWANR